MTLAFSVSLLTLILRSLVLKFSSYIYWSITQLKSLRFKLMKRKCPLASFGTDEGNKLLGQLHKLDKVIIHS